MKASRSFVLLSLSLLLLHGCVQKDEGPKPDIDLGPTVHKSDNLTVVDESEPGGLRYYTFVANRPYQISFRIRKADVDAAEAVLRKIDTEANSGIAGSMFGLNKGTADFNLLYWRGIYNSVYNSSRRTIDRLAGIFRRIKSEENLNDAQLVYVIARFVQFMKYDLPPGVGIYSPDRTLFELGNGDENEPPADLINGWNGMGDCDTKSLLLAMLLQACGYQAVVFDSYRYQHAMAGVALPSADGVYLEFRGVRYYFIETTFPNWNIGQMPPQFSDLSYFYAIDPREDVSMKLHVVDTPPVAVETLVTAQGPSEREGNNDMTTADLVPTLQIQGIADGSDPADWYALGGQEGTYAAFTLLHDDDVDLAMDVYNAGSKVASTGDAGLKCIVASIPALCHVCVRRLEGAGKYSVHITPGGKSENEPNDDKNYPSVVSGTSILGNIDKSGDIDWYVLKGQEGYNATYQIYSDKAKAMRFEIYNDNAMIGSSKGEKLTLEHPGRVMVKLWSQGGPGWYILSLNRNK